MEAVVLILVINWSCTSRIKCFNTCDHATHWAVRWSATRKIFVRNLSQSFERAQNCWCAHNFRVHHFTYHSTKSLPTAQMQGFSCCFPWFFRHLSYGPFWNSCDCDCRLVMLAPELCGLPGTSGLDAMRFCWTKIRLCSREVSFDHQQHTWFCWDACFLWLFFVNCFRIKYLLQGFDRAIIAYQHSVY